MLKVGVSHSLFSFQGLSLETERWAQTSIVQTFFRKGKGTYPFTPKFLQTNSPPGFFFFVFFFCNFYGNSLRPPIFSVTPMRSSGSRVAWKIFFVIFTKLIPRKNFFCIAKILVLMVNINKFFRWLTGWGGGLPTGGGGVSRPVARGQKFMCCVRNPRNINVFVRVPGRVPGREDRWPEWPRNCLCAKCLCAFSCPYFWTLPRVQEHPYKMLRTSQGQCFFFVAKGKTPTSTGLRTPKLIFVLFLLSWL